MGGGRPKKLNVKEQSFLDLYLDPVLHPREICQRLGVSMASYYRYEKELGLPRLRVAVTGAYQFQNKKLFLASLSPDEKYDLNIARHLAAQLGVRMDLQFFDPIEAMEALKKGEVELSIASCSYTKERGRQFDCSHPYILNESPHGILMMAKGAPFDRGRLKLGVPSNSIHAQYALENLSGQFDLRFFKTIHATINAYGQHKTDGLLLHSGDLAAAEKIRPGTECRSQKIYYSSFTPIFISSQTEDWLPLVNKALEQLHERGILL